MSHAQIAPAQAPLEAAMLGFFVYVVVSLFALVCVGGYMLRQP